MHFPLSLPLFLPVSRSPLCLCSLTLWHFTSQSLQLRRCSGEPRHKIGFGSQTTGPKTIETSLSSLSSPPSDGGAVHVNYI
uniref:Putative secreted protein n=1 Tax=Anopheles darlingi TaxID=43151 RepID=A0A2M4DB09_ANODA